MKDKIEIPFGAHDSELKGWEYTIPEGMEAIIKDGKVIVKEKESEDERMRKMLIDRVRSAEELTDELREWILTYLEKMKEEEKYDRMQPVYDNQESFESALDKAWKSYNESGARTVDSCEDNYVECAHAKGFREGYLFGIEKQKEQKPVEYEPQKCSFPDWKLSSDYPKEGCNVSLNGEVKKIQEWSEEDKEALDMCLDAIPKKWKTKSGILLTKWLKDNIRLQSKQEWSEEKFESVDNAFRRGRETGFREGVESVKQSAEWSEEDERNFYWISTTIQEWHLTPEYAQQVHKILSWLKSLRPQQKVDGCISPEEGDIVVNKYGEISVFNYWGHHPDGGNFNDKTYFFAKCTLKEGDFDDDCCTDAYGLRYATPEEIRIIVPYLLSSPRPSWKPSEEQMKALNTVLEHEAERIGSSKELEKANALYEQIKKLI